MMRSLDIAICTYNRPGELAQTIESLAALEPPSGVALRLLLILNACTPEAVLAGRAAATTLPFATHVVEEPVPGLSQARNRAIAESRADWLAFLDDDVKVSPGWARGIVATAHDLQADIVAGRTLLWWRDCERPDWWTRHFDWIVSAFDHGESDHVLSPARAIGANFACSRGVYKAVGLFDSDLGRKGKTLSAGEESDYLARADALGFRCAYSAGALVQHLVAPKRLDEDYFRQIGHHNGRAYYQSEPRRGIALAKSLSYQIFVLARFSLKQATAGRNTSDGRYALVKKWNALGALQALLSRRVAP